MAMAPQGQEYEHGPRPTPSATNRWGPYSGAGDFASNMAVILAALLAALALALALNAAVRYLLRRGRRAGGSEPAPDAVPVDLEKAATPPPTPPPSLVYSAAGTKLAGAAAECAICLAEFVDGDAVRVMPACGHGFHARCIERWLACGRRSSCPTCRAPLAAGTAAPAAAQPLEVAAGAGTAPAGAAQPAEAAADAGTAPAAAGAAQPPEATAAASSS